MKILFILITAVDLLNAKDVNCKFKKVLIETKHETFVTCDLENVKYNGRENFAIALDYSSQRNNTGSIINVMKPMTVVNPDDEEINNLVTQVRFLSSKVSTIPNIVFRTFKQLKVFDASHVELLNINSLSFNNAASLKMIFLQNNRITSVNDYVFVHTKNLTNLDLSNNQITRVQAFAFNSLENLVDLSLSNNKIATLDDKTFHPLISLKWIWLDHNRLSMIHSDLFLKVNQQLHGIFLNDNAIYMISPYVFDNPAKLRFLMLAGNNCINLNFKDHVIPDNAAIKLELRDCHKQYRKVFPQQEAKYNMTQSIALFGEAILNCVNETAQYNAQLEFIEVQVQNYTQQMQGN